MISVRISAKILSLDRRSILEYGALIYSATGEQAQPNRFLRILWLRQLAKSLIKRQMFSHIVIFWTDPGQSNAADEVVANAKKYLTSVPGVLSFHAGKMAPSHRNVVDQSYQVGLNIQFETKQAQDHYQVHPLHLEFVERSKAFWTKVIVYDFE
jgi:Stress responsive A/B Barrel Domain